MGKFLQDFKEFAMKGNIIDMAVGVIVGGAFGKIVSSLVNDIIMPVISLVTGGDGYKNLKSRNCRRRCRSRRGGCKLWTFHSEHR